MGLDNLKAMGDWPSFKPCAGTLAVCASGHSLWDDLYTIGHKDVWEQNFDIMAVNDAGMHIPHRVKHWYSNDWEWLPKWRAARRPRFSKEGRCWETAQEGGIILHSCNRSDGALKWPWSGNGTSTLNAVYTGLALGYNNVVICGAPLDNRGHYFEPEWATSNFERAGDLNSWKYARDNVFDGRVSSLSGNTKLILEDKWQF